MLNDDYQSMAANAIAHAATMAGQDWSCAAAEMQRPSVLFRPSLSIDGNQWCALYGANIQDGVAGFGESPSHAMYDFDNAWNRKLGE
jgi:hypothetical protein